MRIARIVYFTPFLLLSFQIVLAQQPQINVVTTAVPFLRIGPDARAGGLADNALTTSPDANSLFWNIAKTPFSTKKGGVALNYTPWLKDIGVNDVYLIGAGGYYKLDEESAISGGFRFFNLGDIQFTDFFGNPLSTGRPTELSLDFGYSRKLSEKWGVGAAIRYINSNLARGLPANSGVDYKAGTTVAGDLGLYHDGTNDIGKGFKFGLSLTNLGGKISYTNIATEREYIPANFGIGFGYNFVFEGDHKLMLAADFNKLMVPTPPIITGDSATDAENLFNFRNQSVVRSWISSFSDAPGGFSEELQEVNFSLAAEYGYQETFFLRTGYYYEHPNKGNRQYFTAGLGLVVSNTWGIDFSYLVPSGSGTNRNPLSNTLRFGIFWNFE